MKLPEILNLLEEDGKFYDRNEKGKWYEVSLKLMLNRLAKGDVEIHIRHNGSFPVEKE